MDKKNSYDIVKIKGIAGIILFILLIIFVKSATYYNLSFGNELEYLVATIFILFIGFSVWLSQDYFIRCFRK